MENVKIKASDGLILDAIYSKVDNPKALIVIIHGMVEHKERYQELLEVLNKNSYSAIIADLRGHGKSINDEYKLGMIGSVDQMIDDSHKVLEYIKNDNPNVKIYLYSHSMGTLIARNFIKKYSNEIEKLILSGTVAYKPGCGLGVSAAKRRIKKNKNGYSTLLYRMSNNLSKSEDVSWLSYNKENVRNYMDDPLCGYKFTNYSNYVLFSMTYNLHKHNKENNVNKDLKILSISGADDRTTNHTKGVLDSIKHLKKEGFENIRYIEYPNMKHEILAEDNKKAVFDDIIKFFNE